MLFIDKNRNSSVFDGLRFLLISIGFFRFKYKLFNPHISDIMMEVPELFPAAFIIL